MKAARAKLQGQRSRESFGSDFTSGDTVELNRLYISPQPRTRRGWRFGVLNLFGTWRMAFGVSPSPALITSIPAP